MEDFLGFLRGAALIDPYNECMEDQLINIGEASKLLGVCQDTLRDWDKKGVLTPVRTAGKHRRYRLSDIRRYQGLEVKPEESCKS